MTARLAAPRAVAGLVALVPLVVLVLAPTFPQYDSYFHLVWGRGLLDGVAPDFEAYAAPTQHPLYVALGGLASLLGTEVGERALVALTLASLSALVLGVFALTSRLFGPWPAAAAAAFTGTSFALLLYAVRAYVDVPFLALVVWAAVLALRDRRVGAMAVLALAGLLRPEAWVLAGLWWLWTIRGARATGERVALTVLAAAAPVLWAAVDLAVTGDPLHSLHATGKLAEDLGRERGIANVPGALVSFLFDVARPPVALLGVAGAVLAVRRFGPRAMAVPLALLGAGVITFVGTGVFGLSILPRYLTVPVVALCVFAGFGLLGFLSLDAAHPWRARWRTAAIAAGVLGLAFVAIKAPSVGKLRDELRFVRTTHADLVALLDDDAVARARRCGPITFPTYRLVPDARWLLDLEPERVSARSAPGAVLDRGVAVVVRGDKAVRRYGEAAGVSRRTNRVPAVPFARVAERGAFVAYAACPR